MATTDTTADRAAYALLGDLLRQVDQLRRTMEDAGVTLAEEPELRWFVDEAIAGMAAPRQALLDARRAMYATHQDMIAGRRA